MAVPNMCSIMMSSQFLPPHPTGGVTFVKDMAVGARAGVRGSEWAVWPPHPDPLPRSRVFTDSHIECGGEGAESLGCRLF